jgi:hypothetical protein
VGSDRGKILKESFRILNGKCKKGKIPKLWDGKASERIVSILLGQQMKLKTKGSKEF